MGLGLRGNGCTEPLNGHQVSHEAPYGLGYHPTEEHRLKHELEKSPWNRQARKFAGIDWSIQPSLNGHFIRKGDSCPYMGFNEPSFMKRMTIYGGIGEITESMANLFEEEQEVDMIQTETSKSPTGTPYVNPVSLI
ncbi:hypothetical protein MKX03_032756 [Papaver bracteatum]|nr:hypothetical protein MKX03_032756 [Papaver bracteatum]